MRYFMCSYFDLLHFPKNSQTQSDKLSFSLRNIRVESILQLAI